MQPYFFPYLGYYRLLSLVDLFIVYDCVQFPRRGWVHRNKLSDCNGNLKWLTLPLKKDARDVKISDLKFQANPEKILKSQINSFPILFNGLDKNTSLNQILFSLELDPVEYLVRQLDYINQLFNFRTKIIRSSTISIPDYLKGPDRILRIIEHYDSNYYLNSPGGITIYNKDFFLTRGVELKFLKPYSGSYISILERLINEPLDDLKTEINNNVNLL